MFNQICYTMKITCSSKLWIDSIVAYVQRDGRVITFTIRDGYPRTTADVNQFGTRKLYSSLSELLTDLLAHYEDVIVSRK